MNVGQQFDPVVAFAIRRLSERLVAGTRSECIGFTRALYDDFSCELDQHIRPDKYHKDERHNPQSHTSRSTAFPRDRRQGLLRGSSCDEVV